MSKPQFDATPEIANANCSHAPRGQNTSKPRFSLLVVLMSVVVAIVGFVVGISIVGSIWWSVLIAYAMQLSFVLLMFGGYFSLQTSHLSESRYDAITPGADTDRLIDTEPPVWISYQPQNERLNRVHRVAVSAASDRNSRKCCEWLADYDCEVHLCSDHDTLIGDLIAKPARWSLLIIDADHIGGLEAVLRELEYIRSGLAKLPVIILSSRPEKDLLGTLIPQHQNLVLAKPFFRKSLFAALEKLNLRQARDGH